MAIHSPQTLIWLPSAVLCSSTAKSDVTMSYDCTYIWEFHHTLEDCTLAPLNWLEFFWVPWNEMWRWYTVYDENPDRDRDRTKVTKDIPPCLTARQWHNVAWNTVQPTLFSGASAHAAKSPYFLKNPVTSATLWCWRVECCHREKDTKWNYKWSTEVAWNLM